MNRLHQIIIYLLLTHIVSYGQEITIAGRLLDRESGEAVSNAVVVLDPGNMIVTSDRNGQYSFVTFPGRKELSASYGIQARQIGAGCSRRYHY